MPGVTPWRARRGRSSPSSSAEGASANEDTFCWTTKLRLGSRAGRWAYWLDRYHYLGLRVVGQNIGYLAYDREDREVACLLFGAPAWRCRARDQFLEWTSEQRRKQLERVANNSRFLILPWIRVAHL